jgi:hypothetical protein
VTATAPIADHPTMPTSADPERPLLSYAADPERPLLCYAGLIGLFVAACSAFAIVLRRSGRQVPERIDPSDLALVAVATHKASRLLAKDRVTSVLRAPFQATRATAARARSTNARADAVFGARSASSWSARTASGCGSRAGPPPA